MEKKDKYFLQIESKFQSDDEKIILHTLQTITHTGKAEIIPLLFDLLEKHQNDTIFEEVFKIMDQLKDGKSVPFIVSEIENKRSEKYRTRLITSCWQSGLDFSEHILLIVKQFVLGDFLMAIEAFSVIEENIHNVNEKMVLECKDYLIKNLKKIQPDKKPLYIELVKLVESYL
jgi:hypothetical protein